MQLRHRPEPEHHPRHRLRQRQVHPRAQPRLPEGGHHRQLRHRHPEATQEDGGGEYNQHLR